MRSRTPSVGAEEDSDPRNADVGSIMRSSMPNGTPDGFIYDNLIEFTRWMAVEGMEVVPRSVELRWRSS